jgi:hypothetical protein
MSLTDDPADPRLTRGADTTATPQADAYLVLSDDDRAAGFVRPVRLAYRHDIPECGAVTTMARAIAETYARQPTFYGATYCCACRMHRPVGEHGEFVWDDDGQRVGT